MSYIVYQYMVVPIAQYMCVAGVCVTYFVAPALFVRKPSATAVLLSGINVYYSVYQYTVLPIA